MDALRQRLAHHQHFANGFGGDKAEQAAVGFNHSDGGRRFLL
jgi:hypothetical protein